MIKITSFLPINELLFANLSMQELNNQHEIINDIIGM